MNSEKVKEIKEVLHTWKIVFHGITNADILTLINELESENDTLHTNLCEWRKENQQLEKEIKENPFYAKGYADGIKNTYEVVVPDKLKQFAERLKEKCEWIRKEYCCSATVGANDIDETLKEFINEFI